MFELQGNNTNSQWNPPPLMTWNIHSGKPQIRQINKYLSSPKESPRDCKGAGPGVFAMLNSNIMQT